MANSLEAEMDGPKQIDYQRLFDDFNRILFDQMDQEQIKLPPDFAITVLTALSRLNEIEKDLRGEFQRI